jgi:hypothetical protein
MTNLIAGTSKTGFGQRYLGEQTMLAGLGGRAGIMNDSAV